MLDCTRLPWRRLGIPFDVLWNAIMLHWMLVCNKSCRYDLAMESLYSWAKVCPSAPFRPEKRGRGEICITGRYLKKKAIPAVPSASSARMHPNEHILTHIFVDEVIEDVYLRLISRYEEVRLVARVIVPAKPCGLCRPYLYQMSFEPPISRGIFIAWDGVKILMQVRGLFDVSCSPVLRC
jgi:hypothetical protein